MQRRSAVVSAGIQQLLQGAVRNKCYMATNTSNADLLGFWGLFEPLLLETLPCWPVPDTDRFRLVGEDVPLPGEVDPAAGGSCSSMAAGAKAAAAIAAAAAGLPLVLSSLPSPADAPRSCCSAGCLLGDRWPWMEGMTLL